MVICVTENEIRQPEEEKNKIEAGMLYLVATPIGNLADLSARAEKVLSGVDFIAAEDTRVTAKILSHLGISKPLLSYHEHNKRGCGETILHRLQEGASCALVTDAGTPAISDPGEDIARLCEENGIPVTAVPGACAMVDALILSGMPTRRFCFEGFLEGNENRRRERLEALKGERRTMIFYEAPHHLVDTVSLMCEIFGETRPIALCRELTKRNEEVLRLTLGGAVTYFASHAPRGEYVLVLGGAKEETDAFWLSMTVQEHVAFYMASGMPKMDAVKAVARDRGVAKNMIYREMI